MGIVFARKGNRQAAIEYLKKALDLKEDCYEAHIALSTLLLASDEVELAVRHGERAIALQPHDPASYHHLARDLLARRRFAEAIPYLRQAMRLAPQSGSIMQDLATALAGIGERGEAIRLWALLTQSHPRVPAGWQSLGMLYVAERRFEEAIVCARKALELVPESGDAHLLFGLALMGNEGGAFEAESHLQKVVQLKPEDLRGYSAYGLALQEMGRFEESTPYFQKVIQICPYHGQAYYSLINTQKSAETRRPLLDKLLKHIEDPKSSPLDRSYMHYALGKAKEDLGEFEEAMAQYDKATSLASQAWFSGRPSNREWYSTMFDATIETFTPAFMESVAEKGLGSEKPLLVVGMIRSGTTLVEQILSSHPEIVGGGELKYWHDRVPTIFDIRNRRVAEEPILDLAKGYLDLLDSIGQSVSRVTDKLPHNYAMIGFILAAIPNARVIYVKRHPVDNCLSIYSTAFQQPPEFALSRSDIVFWYREHERLMSHWRSVLPADRLLEVRYEDIVEDKEAITRRMIEFAGLPWDDACLHHERNDRAVNTPSVWQVRQPIYKSSVARWKRFEPWIHPFETLLTDQNS